MTTPAQTDTPAWQPLTPGGVAAFARTPWIRLLAAQLIFAAAAAASVVWFLNTRWFPVVGEAIGRLPAQGEIVDGRLSWPETSPQLLAEGKFLSFVVDLNHEGMAHSAAQIEIEFGREDVRVFSLFGYVAFKYPKARVIAFARPDLEPRWGAWAPPILWISFAAVFTGLLASWALLATLYAPAAWLTGFFANRNLDLPGSWKLAGAALLPGSLLMTASVGFYGLGALDLVKFLAAGAAHFVLGWVYLFASPFHAPKISTLQAPPGNPFAGSEKEKGASE